MIHHEGAWGYNVPGDFDKNLTYQLPDFDIAYIGEKSGIWGGWISRAPSFHTPIIVLYFLVAKRGQATTEGAQKFFSWSSGTGLISPVRFEFEGKRYVFDLFGQLTIWQNEEFEKVKGKNYFCYEVELKTVNPLGDPK